jgi:hypothetical protein
MIYRDADEALRLRRDELAAVRQLEAASLPDAIAAVYGRRRARLDAGIAGIACAAVLAVAAAARHTGLTTILHASWICMAAVYFFSREASRHHVRHAVLRTFSPTAGVEEDVLRMSELRPAGVVKILAEEIEWRSVWVPMAALALVIPLTLHYLVAAGLHVSVPDAHDFDRWISLSLLCVGHCHLVLCWQAWRFARAVQRERDSLVVGLLADRAGWHAWGVTIASSVVAGLLLLMVVPVAGVALVIVAPAVVAATGLAFIPAMFIRMGRKIRDERLLLGYAVAAR